MSPLRWPLLWALWGLAATGCTTETKTGAAEAASVLGVPARVPAQVTLRAERDGRYLDANVDTRRSELRFFFPNDPTCRQVLTGSGDATWSNHGLYGRLHRGEQHCDPVGLLSLRAWRDRRPRQTSRGGPPVPRDRASYQVIYSDEDLFMALGRFQLAGLVGWVGGYRTVAVFPNTPECEGLMDRREATMEYRDAGREPLVLLDDRRRCPFLGFAMSLPEPEKEH